MRMKKYLITAALAVAIGGSFMSCRDDSLSGSTIDQKAEAFEEAFVRAFGQPAPNHTWGFGSDDETSEFLHSIGYVGIKFPASDGSTGKKFTNYVIFDEKDIEIIKD